MEPIWGLTMFNGQSRGKTVIYIHGVGGNPGEAAHYRPLFKDCRVIGLDYTAQSPWQAKDEFPKLLDAVCGQEEAVTVIANSIGAYFTMAALFDRRIDKAYFISPIVDMPKLIEDMMTRAQVSEDELRRKGVIETAFGQTLSWQYLSYAREHPVDWKVPTYILYGGKDGLTSLETVTAFAGRTGATLTVMENGEHWLHTDEQMAFLDRWITFVG